MLFRSYAVLIASTLVVAAGCTQSASTVSTEMLASYQSALSLATEPDQAASVLEVRALLGGAEGTAHDDDSKAPHAEDGHGHDVDATETAGVEHAEQDDHDHAELAQDHEGHDEGDAHREHEVPGGHEHREDGHEHAAHEHDGHEHAEHTHEHSEQEHGEHVHEHGEHVHSQASDGREFVIVGKIGGEAGPEKTLSDFPWEKGRATFIMSDPSFEPAHTHDHGDGDGHSHGDHECHFCQAQAIDAQAWVRFLGDDNKPIAVDARELFDVKEGDIVVVKGLAKLSAGLLVVDAKGIYVRR